MLAAIRLHEAGIDHVVLEKNADVGGTWLENAYPGAGVDTPSHLYSYSFAPRRVVHPLRQARRGARLPARRRRRPRPAQGHPVRHRGRRARTYARPALDRHHHRRRDARGRRRDHRRRAAQPAEDPRRCPAWTTFRGPLFHSARWPDDLDVAGKRVAIIGTGASAMQIVPAIAGTAGHVTVFQRSPQWARPTSVYFTPIDDAASLLMEHVPFYRRWYRTRLAWNTNDRVHPRCRSTRSGSTRERSVNAVNDGHRRVFTRYLEPELAGRDDLRRQGAAGLPAVRQADAARQRLVRGAAPRRRRPRHRAGRRRHPGPACAAADGTEVEADVVVLCTGLRDAQAAVAARRPRPRRRADRRRSGAPTTPTPTSASR